MRTVYSPRRQGSIELWAPWRRPADPAAATPSPRPRATDGVRVLPTPRLPRLSPPGTSHAHAQPHACGFRELSPTHALAHAARMRLRTPHACGRAWLTRTVAAQRTKGCTALPHGACVALQVVCCLLHDVACCLLLVACCVLHVVCCMLRVARCLLRIVCCGLFVVCCLLHVVCRVRFAGLRHEPDRPQRCATNAAAHAHSAQAFGVDGGMRLLQRTTGSMQPATCDMQHAACVLQPVKSMMQHTRKAHSSNRSALSRR